MSGLVLSRLGIGIGLWVAPPVNLRRQGEGNAQEHFGEARERDRVLLGEFIDLVRGIIAQAADFMGPVIHGRRQLQRLDTLVKRGALRHVGRARSDGDFQRLAKGHAGGFVVANAEIVRRLTVKTLDAFGDVGWRVLGHCQRPATLKVEIMIEKRSRETGEFVDRGTAHTCEADGDRAFANGAGGYSCAVAISARNMCCSDDAERHLARLAMRAIGEKDGHD